MAVRVPLYMDAQYNIREMTAAQISALKQRCIYAWGGNPSVVVQLTADGLGNLDIMKDTAVEAGTVYTSTSSAAPTDGSSTGDTSAYDVFTFDRTSQDYDLSITQDPDASNLRNFVYMDGTDIRAFSHTDMFDTFYDDVLNIITSGDDIDGTYRIGTSVSLSGHTLVSGTSVFTDTVFGGDAATWDLFANPTENPQERVSDGVYYLFVTNQGFKYGVPNIVNPIRIRASTNDIEELSDATVDTIFRNDLRYWGVQKIRYVIDTTGTISGQQRGSAIINHEYNGFTVVNADDGADDYRAQEIPSGSLTAVDTYVLKIRRL